MQFDHIGVIVEDIDQNTALFETLGLEVGPVERMPELNVKVAFVDAGEGFIELVEPTGQRPTLEEELQTTTGTAFLHHVAFRVEDIGAKLSELRATNVALADEGPRPGVRDSRIAFLAQSAGNGVRIELVERSGDGVL